MITLTPYLTDYKTKAEVLEALKTKDFTINEFGHPYDGKPCHIKDLPDKIVKVRWNKLTKVCLANPADYK